jgi:hypothetical protein
VGKVYTLISVHTEDCVNPETDDVPLRLAQIANRHGCQVVPKVTTEKIRSLRRHGRQDVIEALKTQDVGFHMTNHSFPPTVPVYTQRMSWDEGVREYERQERAGYDEWRATFERDAPTYAQGVATPFAFPVLRRWGIPTYTCSSCVSLGGLPMHYQGIVKQDWGPPNGFHLGFRVTEPGMAETLRREFDAIYRRLHRGAGGLVSVSSHEVEWATHEFWDENFRQGKLVLPKDFRRARVKTPQEMERGLKAFDRLVGHIQALPDSAVISARKLYELYRDRLVGERLSMSEVAALAEAVAEEITFQPVRGQHASAAEVFGLVVSALARYFRTGRLPKSVRVRFLGGPPRADETARRQGPMTPEVFAHVLADVEDALRFYQRIPAEAWRGNEAIATGDFLATAARLLVSVHRNGEAPKTIKLARGHVTCLDYAPERAEVSTWPSFPPGFADHNGVALARLQCWTLKPAVQGTATA